MSKESVKFEGYNLITIYANYADTVRFRLTKTMGLRGLSENSQHENWRSVRAAGELTEKILSLEWHSQAYR